jgi:hypothetical protein
MATTGPRTSNSDIRRALQATALVVGPLALVGANLGDALTRSSGQDDTTARGALEISAAHPLADTVFPCVAMLGCLLMIPAVLGAMSLLRSSAACLSLVSGVLVITGYVCYFALLFQGLDSVSLAQHGGATTTNIAIQDQLNNTVVYVVVALTFVVGNIIGTFLLGLALLRSRTVTRWAACAVLAWPVLHILGGPWGEVAGALLQTVGLAVVGRALLTGHVGDAPDRRASTHLRASTEAVT